MEILFLFLFVWLPCSVFIGWLASKRGRSGVAWGLLSLLLSPVICLLALLLLSDLKAEATKQTREEKHYRDQLAVLSDIKAKMQTPAAHLDKPQPEAVIESVSIPTGPVLSPAMAADPFLSASPPVAANAGNSGASAFKRRGFNPLAIAVGILIIVVAILVVYVLQLQKETYSSQMSASSINKIDLVNYEVDDQNIKKYNGQWGDKAVLIVNVNGNNHEGPTDKHLSIEGQGDFNGDGITDALISTDAGGSSSPIEFHFVSIYDGKIVTAPVDINHSDFEFMVESGRTVVKTTIGGEMIFWGFDGQKVIKVRSVKLPLKIISSTALCLQNKPKTACPMIWDVLREDEIFKNKFKLILKSQLSESDINLFFNEGVSSGFELIKTNGKQYIKSDWLSKSIPGSSVDVNFLIEIKGDTSGSQNRLTAMYDGKNWLNNPTEIEKEIISSHNFIPR